MKHRYRARYSLAPGLAKRKPEPWVAGGLPALPRHAAPSTGMRGQHDELREGELRRSTILHRRMSDIHPLARARKSFEQHTWAESYRLFEAADREAPLEPADLERFATAAYLMGREDESEAFWE